MLHIISSQRALSGYMNKLSAEDEVLFVEQAVTQLHKKSLFVREAGLQANTMLLYALESDVRLNGLNVDEIASAIQLVDYAGFVRLTEKHKVIKTWN